MPRIDHVNLSAMTKPRVPSASDMASDIFYGTHVESIYDARGEFSHLLATLSRDDFFRLYGVLTSATIFIDGYWFELCLKSTQKTITNRATQMQLGIDIMVDEWGRTLLSFSRNKKCVAKFKFKKRTVKELLTSEDGFYMIARAATQVFNASKETFLAQKSRSGVAYPTIIVVCAPEPIKPVYRPLTLCQ